MTINALAPLVPTWFTPEGQSTDAPTRFRVRPLSGAEYGDVSDHVSVQGERTYIANAGRERCLQHALIGWENFVDASGPLEFNAVNLARIPYLTRMALVAHIMEISSLSGEQVKN